ncbi:hypothetical protein L3Q82_011474, partial [Scortum barcoo]
MTSLDWSDNTNALVKKGNSRLFLLRRLRSFGVQGPLLRTFYDSVVASAIFYWDSLLGQQHHGQGQEENGQTGEEGQLCPGMPLWTQWRWMGNGRMMAKLSVPVKQHVPPSTGHSDSSGQLLQFSPVAMETGHLEPQKKDADWL